MIYVYALVAVAIIAFVMIRVRARRLKPEQFMEIVRARIAEKHPNITLESPVDFGWQCQLNGQSILLSLDNLYAQYQRLPGRLEELIDNFAAGIGSFRDDHPDWDDVKSKLFPLIKPDEYFQAIRDTPGGSDLAESLELYNLYEGLKVVMAIDEGRSMRLVRKEDLEHWNIPRDAIADQAIKNLAAETAPLWAAASEGALTHGFLQFANGDGYDASRMLLPDFHERVSRALGCERVVVIIPTRDLLVAFNGEKADVSEVKKIADTESATGSYPLTNGLVFLTRSAWPPEPTFPGVT